MSQSITKATAPGTRIARAFSGMWAGLFTVAILWLAAVAITFFSALGRGQSASLWGMEVIITEDSAFVMTFDGPQVLMLLAAGALVGAVAGSLIPVRR